MQLSLKIIDLNGVYFQGEVDLVNLTIASGNVTILANHIPLISSIDISHMYEKSFLIVSYLLKVLFMNSLVIVSILIVL